MDIRLFFVASLVCLLAPSQIKAADPTPVRTVTVFANPDCTEKTPECNKPTETGSINNLIYVQATGSNDTIHVLYSNVNAFSILMFKTVLPGKITVNWTELVSTNATQVKNAIQFSEAVVQMGGYVFPTIYEFNDENGTADMTQVNANASNWVYHQTADLVWKNFTSNVANSMGVFEGSHPKTNGSFQFVVRFPGKTVRDTDLPHLLLNADSGSVDFIVDSIDPKFKDSKFGLGVLFASTAKDAALSKQSTIDDEYTPGTFKIWNVAVSDAGTIHNYFQWKPIFYYYNERSLENSTITRQYDLLTNIQPPTSVASAFFDHNTLFQGTNVSFGLQGDEKDGYFYIQTNYSVWTFSFGMGAAPAETMSFIVTLVIFIGFGLPALVIVLGLFVMVVKKYKKGKQYDEL